MKATVIKDFRDKHTKESRRIGDEIDVEDQRFEELVNDKRGAFVEAITEEETEETEAESKKESTAEVTEETNPKKAVKKTTKKAGKGA